MRQETGCRPVCYLITRWAQTQPDHPAVSLGDRTFSYRELENSAARIAQLLISKNVCPGDKGPVLARRSPEMVACFLGIAKAGACYIPVDVES